MKFNTYIDTQPIEIEFTYQIAWPRLLRHSGENGGHKIVIPIGECVNETDRDSLDVKISMIVSDVHKLLREGYGVADRDCLSSACLEIRSFIFESCAAYQ